MRIVEHQRAHRRHIAVILALLACAFVAPVASARAPASGGGLNLRASYVGARAWSGSPGVRSETVSAGARSAVLAEGTGLTPSEVSTENVCGEPVAGRARCAAQILVLRGTHDRVHPRVPRTRTFTQVFPRVRRAGAPSASSSPPASGLTAHSPAWIQQAYDLTYLSQTAGVGDTVAIVDAYHDPTAEADLGQYRANYGLSACTTANGCFRQVNENGQSSPMPPNNKSWEQEISLDLDAVSAVCPNCHVLLVEAATNAWGDLATALQTAATMGAKQIANSYSGYWWGTWPYTDTFPGVSVVAATGDHGFLNQGDTDTSAHGYNNYPAALPGVIAAGGTSLAAASGGQSARGYAESAWALTSSGWGADSGCETALPKPAYQTDTGCTGRAYSDVSADADPSTGLNVYDSGNGGWLLMGGTSLSTPVIAAYEAVTGITASDATPQWAYTDSALLNDPVSGSVGTCPQSLAYLCAAGVGYDGPTGMGSISGAVAPGAPGIGGPTFSSGYVKTAAPTSLTLLGGVYPNGLDTTYYWQYGQTNAYGQQTAPVDIGAGQAPVSVTDTLAGLITGTTYHARLVAANSTGTSYGYDFTGQTLLNGQLPPSNTTPPAITGTAQEGQTLVVSGGAWSPAAATYAYKWQRSADGSTWSDIGGAGNQGYLLTAADVGDQIRVIVTAANSFGSATATASSVGPVRSGAPANSALPAITGTVQQGQSLSAGVGTWSPAGTAYTYQWQRSTDNGSSWTNIANATSSRLIPADADVATFLRVLVTATNPYGTATIASGPVGPVSSGAPKNIQAPVINGTPRQGQVLTVSSDWNPAGTTYAYLWERSADGKSWSTVASATGSSYTPTAADEGLSLRVTVTATNIYGQASNTSATAGPIATNPPVNTTSPTISGTTQRTFTLHAALGAWNGANNAYSYQWQRSVDGTQWSAISSASGPAYTLTLADVGDVVRVLVTASNVDGIATQASSATTLISPDPPSSLSPPTITGAAQRTSTLAASLGTWTGPDNVYTYQWQRDAGDGYVDIAGETARTYTLAAPDEGAVVRVVVTATNPDATISEASQPTVTVLGAGPANQSPPVLSGAAQRASTLTASSGLWGGLGNSYTYQWQRSPDGSTWSDISGQTGTSYVVGTADEGNAVRVLVTATNADGVAAVPSAPTATIPAAAPANTAAPTVNGTAQRATMLTSDAGTWTGIGNAYTYQWQRSSAASTWTNVAGQTAWTYTPTTADEGAQVRVLVTATNPDGTLTVPSAPTATVQASAPSSTTAPSVAGSAQRGVTLTGTPGAWDGFGNTYAYQWQRSSGSGWTDIAGATSPAYTLAVADEGQTIRLKVTATNADGAVNATSSATGTVQASAPVNTIVPTIAGVAQRTTTLTSAPGTWTGNANVYTDQWQRSADGTTWTPISGATGAMYTLAVPDEGSQVRLVVTATNPDGSVSAASTASGSVVGGAPVNTAVPAMTGSSQRGSVLTVTPGAWSGIANTYAFQWQRSADGLTWANISGETAASHVIGVADEGDSLRVTVTATNADGTATAAGSATDVVPSSPPSNTTVPAVTGTAQRSFLLTATQGTWAGIGNTYTFQWQHDTGAGYVDIVGQTGTTYTLGVPDEGTTIRVLITATNPDGTATKTSAPTASVLAAAPKNTGVPTLTGTPQRGSLLTGTIGTWDGIGNAYAYQWQRSADGTAWTAIPGATNPTYTPAVADEGAEVRVQVTATNADGSATASSSATTAVTGGKPDNLTPPTFAGAPQRAVTLAVTSNGNWDGIGNTLTRQWQRSADGGQTWTNIAGQTDGSYTLTLADEGAQVRLLVTATNADGATGAASAPSATVSAAPAVNTTAPAVTGTPQRGGTLTVSQGSWSGPDNTYAFQWQRSTDHGTSWSKITGATIATYRPLAGDEGAIIRAQVTASNPDGAVTATAQATSAIQAAPPVNLTPPTVTGNPQRTMTLTATQGTWSGADNTYLYQWQRSTDQGATWTPIVGANAVSYTLQTADENANIRVFITATNPDSGAGIPSPATPAIQPAAPVSTAAPTVSGGAHVNGTLTAAPGTWTPAGASFAYQWQRSAGTSTWTDISGATSPNYTLASADVAHVVRVLVTATNLDGHASASSAATGTVAQPPQNIVPPPAPTGTLMDTYRLTADPGTWDTPGATFAYAWLRCPADATRVTEACVQVGSGSTYTLGGADVGQSIAVNVTATSPGGTAPALASQVTSIVVGRQLTNLTPPNISGNPQIPSTLIANPGTWSVPLSGIAYTWQRCDMTGGACVQAGTGTQYTLGEIDHGHTIELHAQATSPGWSVGASSQPLTIQDQALPQASALPIISGAAVRTVTLTATAGVWTNAPSAVAYQWLRCSAGGTGCQTIPGATTASYSLAMADEGHAITVRVTATNTSGNGTATSRATDPVSAAPPSVVHPPAVSGTTYQQDVPLSVVANSAVWVQTPDTTFTAMWKRCDLDGTNCQAIDGANATQYTPSRSDVGHALELAITATNPDGSATSTSTPTQAIVPAPPRWRALPLISADPGHVGDVLTITPGVWSGTPVNSDNVQMMRCTNTCSAVGPADATSYTITTGDLGAIVRVREYATNAGGYTVIWSARFVGPVSSAASGSAVVADDTAARVRNTQGIVLALASLQTNASANVASVRTAGARHMGRTLVLRRGPRAGGRLRAWACPVATLRSGAPAACTAKVSVGARTSLSLPTSMTGRIRVIVVRQRY